MRTIPYKLSLIIVLVLFIITACQDACVDIDDYSSEIVVDGWIENGEAAKVLLTLSSPYFGKVDSASLRDYVLTRAKVTLTSSTEEEILTLGKNEDFFPPYYYRSVQIKGEVGEAYALKVEYGGRVVQAETSIPEPSILDSIYYCKLEGNDTLGYLKTIFTDGASTKDYYRTMTKIKGEDNNYIPTYLPDFSDTYFNGQTVEKSFYKGNKSTLDKEDELYFNVGDTISFKFCKVDKVSYDFWRTLHREFVNAGSPFATTHSLVESNVSNGLGIWCGYGVSKYRIIAQ